MAKRISRRKEPSLLFQRLIAFGLDLIIINLTILAPFQTYLLGVLKTDRITPAVLNNPEVLSMMYPAVLFGAIFAFFYFSLLDYALGQTVGKIIMNLKVKSEKGRLSLFQSMLRNLIILPFFPFTFFWFADPIYYFFFRQKEQRLSEVLSKTKIHKVKS